MWILKGPKDELYYLLPGKHVVGRKNCDLVLGDDQSISRTHVIIEVTHLQCNWGNPAEKPVVEVSDAGSKYGTTLINEKNTIKLEKNVKHHPKEGDVIHFGVQFSEWRLSYEPLIVVVSSLPKAEKQKVRTVVGELGGHVVTDWHPQTSHLTMATVTMTVKAISALAHAKPIVTPQFWIALKTAIKSKEDLPKCEDYVPRIGEPVLNEHEVSFLVDPRRKSLFTGKTFYFFSEPQFKDHGCMVQAAGGVSKFIRAVRHSQMNQFVDADAVVMQLLSANSQTLTLSQVPEVFPSVCEFLKSYGKRLIPASEIGLAVLHCSVEKYCNPDYNFSSMLLRNSEESQRAVPDRILATETQENSVPSQPISDRKVIPDSGESKVGPSLSIDGSSVAPGHKGTEELLHNNQQATQGATQLSTGNSQSQSQGPDSENILACSSKRLRVIDESDDEVEVLPPRKFLAGAANAKQRNPVVVTIEENKSDVEVSTSVPVSASSSKISRSNVSRASRHDDDSDDPDQLFADFKESQPKARNSANFKRPESPEMDADDLFADFQDDIKSSAAQKSVASCKPVQTSVRSTISMSPACKRDLPSDDESGPPEKRFTKLDLSKQREETEEKNTEEEFISTTQVKKEDVSFNVKPSCNVTVVFKPLMISKSRNTSAESSESSLEFSGIANYKKFKKVNPLSNSAIPRIIGGRDLQPYQSFSGNSSIFKGVNDHADESDDEEGPNTLWGALTQKTNWKQNRSRKL